MCSTKMRWLTEKVNDEQGPDEGKQYSSEDHHQRPVPGKMCSRPRKQADQTST